jgi:hypothetical protein
MFGQAVLELIGSDVGVGEIGDRIDLDAVVRSQLEMRQHAALLSLVALAARHPAAEALHGEIERLGLADMAAGIGVGLPQVPARIEARDVLGIGRERGDIAEPQVPLQRLDVLERLGKMLARFEEVDRQRRIDLRHHVQQHRGVRAE